MPVVVIDLESNGFLGDSRTSVIEIGAVALSDVGDELGSFCSLVRPRTQPGAWCQRAMDVNRIDPNLLLTAPFPTDVWHSFFSWMKLYKPVRKVLAFNIGFDQGMMIKTFPVAEGLPWGPCIMRAASFHLDGTKKSISLREAVKQLDLEDKLVKGSHRADTDARAAALVWAKLRVLVTPAIGNQGSTYTARKHEKNGKGPA